MAGNINELMGPKVTKDKPTWPSGTGVGLIPISVHPSYSPWPFVRPSNGGNILPNKSGLKPAK
jgi:hypothetical protein